MSNKVNFRAITYKSIIFVTIFCITLSGLWSLLPVVGWSYYTPEGI